MQDNAPRMVLSLMVSPVWRMAFINPLYYPYLNIKSLFLIINLGAKV